MPCARVTDAPSWPWGRPMERGAGLRNPPGQTGIVETARPERRRSMAPHHRRRRAVAILSLVAIALLVTALLAGGGAAPQPTIARPDGGFFAVIRELATAGPGSLSAREAQAENAAINRTLAYTPYVRIAGAQHREIALTFDDGPGPYTPQVLAILQREHVPATFFEVGILERYFNASTTEIAADGDVIGDHTEVHAAMSKLSPAKQRAQLLEQASAIERYGASFPRLFRPPYGLWNATTLALLHRYRMLMVLWTVDTNDYRRPGVPRDRRLRRRWSPARSDHPAPRRRRRSFADRRRAAEDHRGAPPAPLRAGDGSAPAARQPGAARPEHRGGDRVRGVDQRRT